MGMEQFTLDFSTSSNPKIECFKGFFWQKKIIDFLNEWNGSKIYLTVNTSGSTGTPKEIQLLKEHAVKSAQATGNFLNIKKGSTALLCLPINYIAGKMMLIRAFVLGLKLICIKPKSKVSLKNQKINFCAMTPMQATCSKGVVQLIEKLIIGGAPIPPLLRRRLSLCSTEIYESFGMTETISHFAMRNISKGESFFTVLPSIRIKIDEESRLSVKMPWSRHWILTNDLAKPLNDRKFIWIGRLDNVVNSGGIKLFPEEIEKKLESMIKYNFIIAPIPDKMLGESLILIVEGVLADKEKSQLQKIIDKTQVLNKYEKPKDIHLLSEFIRTPSGKINRRETIKMTLQNKFT